MVDCLVSPSLCQDGMKFAKVVSQTINGLHQQDLTKKPIQGFCISTKDDDGQMAA